MTEAYVVTESEHDVAILRRILPDEIIRDIELLHGGGRYGAHSFANTILTVKQLPVALVIDADTEDELLIREQKTFLNDWLAHSSANSQFAVFMAVPEMESIFFQDKALSERIFRRELSQGEWETARHAPKRFLDAMQGGRHAAVTRMLDGLTTAQVRALQDQPPIRDLIRFISGVIASSRNTSIAG